MSAKSKKAIVTDVHRQESQALKAIWDRVKPTSQGAFAKEFGIGGQTAVSNFLTGTSALSMKAAVGFATGLGCDIADFSPRLAAEAATIANATLAQDTSAASNIEPGPAVIRPPRPIPVVGAVKGGDDGYLERLDYPVNQGEGSVLYWTSDERAYALRVKGDSMYPRYRAGEFVIVTPSIEAIPGHDVVVSLINGKKLLKQLNWIKGNRISGEVQLLSINNGYAPMTIERSEVESIQRVAGSVPSDAFTPN